MVKTLKIFSVTKRHMTLKLGMQLKYYQVCSNDDPGLTLTYFMLRSNLFLYAFVWEKYKTMDISETIQKLTPVKLKLNKNFLNHFQVTADRFSKP